MKIGDYLKENLSKQKEIVFLVGLPGSGKSTYIDKNYRDYVVVSTDNIIEKYAKKWNVDYNTAMKKLDFKIAERESRMEYEKAVNARKNIVIDKTNLTVKSRRRFDTPRGYKKIAVVFDVSESELKNRLEKRKNETGKIIPQSTFDQMKGFYVEPKESEGFDEIIHVRG